MLAFSPIVSLFLLNQAAIDAEIVLSTSATANEMHKDIRGNIVPPARDPKLADEEEYQLALQQGTAEALQLFIARHPDSPFAEKARDGLKRLSP